MSRTRYRPKRRCPCSGAHNPEPSKWRKEENRPFRARNRQAMREGCYEMVGHPRRDRRGWYW